MRRLHAFFAMAVAVAVLASCGSFSGYAAKVNGTVIARDEIEDELKAILGNKKLIARIDQAEQGQPGGAGVRGAGKGTFTTVFIAGVLEERISLSLIHQEVQRRKLVPTAEHKSAARQQVIGGLGGARGSAGEAPTPEQQAAEKLGQELFNGFPRSYRDKLVVRFSEVIVLQEALGPPKVNSSDVAAFYEENRASFDRTCVRHILTSVEDPDAQAKATAIRARIAAGEDFATIATAESADRGQGGDGGSAAQGGALGCVPSGDLVPEFSQAMDALQPGQVSDVVKTQFGFHIIEVTARQSLTLEEAAPQIRQSLSAQAANPIGAFLAKARQRAKIVVNPRYGTFDKSGPTPGVRPPKGPTVATSTPADAPLLVPGQ